MVVDLSTALRQFAGGFFCDRVPVQMRRPTRRRWRPVRALRYSNCGIVIGGGRCRTVTRLGESMQSQ
jgi:hypothetical protein